MMANGNDGMGGEAAKQRGRRPPASRLAEARRKLGASFSPIRHF